MKKEVAMENYILWIIIAAYLFFVFLKSKKQNSLEKTQTTVISKTNNCEKKTVAINKNGYEAAVITAAIAAALGSEKSFFIKKVSLVDTPDKYISSWKTAGRTETIMRKFFR